MRHEKVGWETCGLHVSLEEAQNFPKQREPLKAFKQNKDPVSLTNIKASLKTIILNKNKSVIMNKSKSQIKPPRVQSIHNNGGKVSQKKAERACFQKILVKCSHASTVRSKHQPQEAFTILS